MRILVTGADGFVGSHLLPALRAAGHAVVGALRPVAASQLRPRGLPEGMPPVALELTDPDSVARALSGGYDAVVHLAGVASGADAQRDVLQAWNVNAMGTVRVAEALCRAAGDRDPLLLVVSSADVYGAAGVGRPRVETDAVAPCSPYGASKLAAEIGALEVHRRTGLRVVVARAFPHTGAGQDERFVVPAFARRLRQAKARGAATIRVGNLEPVRECNHVADIVDAYVRLLRAGEPGEVYNVASGQGYSLREVFYALCELLAVRVQPEPDPALLREADVPYVVGDGAKLRGQTGWTPVHTLTQTLSEVLDAQAD